MARDLTAGVITESKKTSGARPLLIVKLEFDGGTVKFWNGRGDLVFASETYTGIGDLGRISEVEEGIEQRAFGISLEISGVPSSNVSLALSEELQNRRAQVWLGFFDDNYALVADPVLMFKGRMDTMDIKLGKTATIAVTAESRLIDWSRPRIRRYTDADQRERFPGDKGFQFVSDTTDKEIVWGAVIAGGQGGGAVAAGQSGSGGGGTREREQEASSGPTPFGPQR